MRHIAMLAFALVATLFGTTAYAGGSTPPAVTTAAPTVEEDEVSYRSAPTSAVMDVDALTNALAKLGVTVAPTDAVTQRPCGLRKVCVTITDRDGTTRTLSFKSPECPTGTCPSVAAPAVPANNPNPDGFCTGEGCILFQPIYMRKPAAIVVDLAKCVALGNCNANPVNPVVFPKTMETTTSTTPWWVWILGVLLVLAIVLIWRSQRMAAEGRRERAT